MARGITENDVHTAADELVAAGERPTVDRIRGHLGTGSPNTVTRWLETWWQALAPRLSERERASAIPDVPKPVARLAQQLWEQALEMAHTGATEALAHAQATVASQAQDLLRDQEELAAQAQSLHAAAESAQAAREAAEARLADAHKVLERQAQELETWRTQCHRAQQRGEALESELTELRSRYHEAVSAAAGEREGLLAHVRNVEDRAHAQIDGVRQEAIRERVEMQTHLKRLQSDAMVLQTRADEALRALALSQQEAAGERARADTLAGLSKRGVATPTRTRNASKKTNSAAKPPGKRV